jgi:hypothetical protein
MLNGEKLVGGENFPVDTGRCTGPRGMGFSSSNGRWHLQRSNDWHGQHDHHGAQPGDGLVSAVVSAGLTVQCDASPQT